MRFPKFQALLAIFALAFSAGVFAQGANEVPELNEAQIQQLEAATNLNAVVETLIDNGADPRAVAAALAERGQTNAQIRAALVAAGVSNQDLGMAIASANVARTPGPDQNGTTSTIVEVTGAGLLIGEDGLAVVVRNSQDQMKMAAAFIAASLEQDADFFDNPAASGGIAGVITEAILAANPSANATVVAAAVINALQNANFGTGGNSAQVLNQALQTAANNIGGGIFVPPISES